MNLITITLVSIFSILAQSAYNPHTIVEGFYWD